MSDDQTSPTPEQPKEPFHTWNESPQAQRTLKLWEWSLWLQLGCVAIPFIIIIAGLLWLIWAWTL